MAMLLLLTKDKMFTTCLQSAPVASCDTTLYTVLSFTSSMTNKS